LVTPGVPDSYFRIENIELYPENTLRIYNRWGVLVYEVNGYNNTNNLFKGISNGRLTIQEEEELPPGVYFYTLDYLDSSVAKSLSGYLYVNR